MSSIIYTYVNNYCHNWSIALLDKRIEAAIRCGVGAHGSRMPLPKTLNEAIQYSVFPGGARIRPTILLSVAIACGDDIPGLADSSAAALEMIHCASLVHDDLPCFDNAETRRGQPSVHNKFGESTAVLVGDSLISNAFGVIAESAQKDAVRAVRLISLLSRYSGFPNGICAGQAWEAEDSVDLTAYHQSKTGALFIAATQMGAASAGHDPEPWFELGARIGEAFQVADDLLDVLCSEDETGKPSGQDLLNHRPNAVSAYGVDGAKQKLRDILGGAISSIPSCPGEAKLAEIVRLQSNRLLPKEHMKPVA
jgi:geranylgeranyl diphosphate synthase type II